MRTTSISRRDENQQSKVFEYKYWRLIALSMTRKSSLRALYSQYFRMKLTLVTSLCLVARAPVVAASALSGSAALEKRACLPALNYTVEIEYVGCYTDPTTPRTLTGASFTLSSNSPENCGFLCGRAGYSYAGVEYTRYDLLYTMRHEKLLTALIQPVLLWK